MPERARCDHPTANGRLCRSFPKRGETLCAQHLVADNLDARRERTRPGRWDRAGFLLCFEYAGTVTAACEMLHVSRTTVYEEKQRNEDFAVAWADVEERSTERMELEAYRRAVLGTTKPMLSAGKIVTTVQEFSDSLLMFMLKARRPERYRENVTVKHSGGLRVDAPEVPETEERLLTVAALMAEIGVLPVEGV